MRLGFYYHIPAIMTDNRILVPGYLGGFLDQLAMHCEELTLFLHAPNPDENANFDYEIHSDNVKLVNLEPRGSVPFRMFHAAQFSHVITKHQKSLDALMLRGPTPLLPAISRSVMITPTILLIVGDYLAGVSSLSQPWWRRELIRYWARSNYHGQMKAARKSLVFVNSQVLYQQYITKVKNLHETHTTTLTSKDFFLREDTCSHRPIRLLYTGRLDPAKGLLDMVEALSIMVDQGEDVVLDLVGWSEKGVTILSDIELAAEKRGVKERIIFHGYKALGSELFAFYKAADLYLIASQSSEGFPRTIWEAMAHSLPVVATRVGSIPDYIQGAAVLVEPQNPDALAVGIKRVIHDPVLRKANINQGFQLASQNTLEIQVSEMVKIIRTWINAKNE